MPINDVEFERLLGVAVCRAAELDYMPELSVASAPSDSLKRKMAGLLENPLAYARRQTRPVYMRILRAAASVLVAASVLLGLSMLNPDVRARVVRFFGVWFGDHTEYTAPNQIEADIPDSIELGYIPEGFELDFEIYDTLAAIVSYKSPEDYFRVNINHGAGRVNIDNEHSEFYILEIDGYLLDVYESNDANASNKIVYYDIQGNVIVYINGTVSVDELTKIATNLNY